MKKIAVLVAFLMIISMSVSAQGFYFDIGLGIGGAWTKINGIDFSDTLKSLGVNVKELGVDLGLKAGYGPIANIPLYIVGSFGGIGHRINEGSEYIQFNSYLIGPGLIYYPIPLIQLAGSVGFSFISNQTNIPGMILLGNDKPGFAGDISVALDFGRGNHGFLLGLRYFGATNTFEVSGVKQNSSALTVFGRYAFRNKLTTQ